MYLTHRITAFKYKKIMLTGCTWAKALILSSIVLAVNLTGSISHGFFNQQNRMFVSKIDCLQLLQILPLIYFNLHK